jgi:predicted DsbA family dithiol-disulfide isomerase
MRANRATQKRIKVMLVEIFADFVCPWCWIGRHRFLQALNQRPGIQIEIAWRPYRLNPALPPEGMDRTLYVTSKFGDAPRVEAMYALMTRVGTELGLDFAWDRIERAPNTLLAHRLVRLAERAGLADAMVERLFAAYFRDGVDLGDADALARLASEIALEAGETARFLASDEDRAAVLAADGAARRHVDGVPYYVFDRRFALAGAQDSEAFLPVFDAVRAA